MFNFGAEVLYYGNPGVHSFLGRFIVDQVELDPDALDIVSG